MLQYTIPRTKKHASAMGVALSVSLKQSVEVCREIRGKKLSSALLLLNNVIAGKDSISFKRYNHGGVGHRTGKSGPARMPMKTCESVAQLLSSAKANAENKGLDTENLVVRVAVAKKAPTATHYRARHSGRRVKRAHIEILLEETKPVSFSKDAKKKVNATPKRHITTKQPQGTKTTESQQAQKDTQKSEIKAQPKPQQPSPVSSELPTSEPTKILKNMEKTAKANEEAKQSQDNKQTEGAK